tara:strand:+ start:886 stop:1464 length:579 start_codon:yes stop_codon:yes gene_type:complete
MILKVKNKMSDKMVYSNSLFNISALDQFGMLTVRAEIKNRKFQKIIKDFFKLSVPSRLKISTNKIFFLAWMSPNEILVITKNQDEIKTIKSSIENDLAGLETLVLDVSSSRTIFSVNGYFWRELLAKGSPINLFPSEFNSGSFRRTRLGQVSTAFWMIKEDEIYILCGQSYKNFFFKWLCNAADEKSISKFF